MFGEGHLSRHNQVNVLSGEWISKPSIRDKAVSILAKVSERNHAHADLVRIPFESKATGIKFRALYKCIARDGNPAEERPKRKAALVTSEKVSTLSFCDSPPL